MQYASVHTISKFEQHQSKVTPKMARSLITTVIMPMKRLVELHGARFSSVVDDFEVDLEAR